MSEPAQKQATYDDLYNIPENMIGEIIDGELIVNPRPSRMHTLAASYPGGEIIPSYCHGRGGGPGGWIILIEPEIGFGEHIMVPDLAGWKVRRYPKNEPHNWISVVPDWVCEVLSPDSRKRDRIKKMPVYAQYGVPYFWLIDPGVKTLDVFRLENGHWMVDGFFVGDDMVRAMPFDQIEFNLADLWQDTIDSRNIQGSEE